MKLALMLFTCIMASYFGMSEQAGGKTRITESGKVLRSPSYPRAPNQSQRYYIKAPANHIVILKFFLFKLSSHQREFLRISDGRRGNEASIEEFKGNKGRFKYVSKRNVLRILFRHYDDGSHSSKVFWARVYFVNTTSHCNYTSLFTQTGVTAATCESKVDDFATQCTVQCENPEEKHEAHCNDGIFLHEPCTEYCDLDSFQMQNATLTSCNLINERASHCQIHCHQHYVGSGPAVCQNGAVIANSCLPNASLVRQCEDSEMLDCPFSLQEVVRFYENSESFQDEILSEELERDLDSLPDPEIDLNESALGRAAGGEVYYTCPNYVCNKKWIRGRRRYIFPCGLLLRRKIGKLTINSCMVCRYEVNCQRPVPGALFT